MDGLDNAIYNGKVNNIKVDQNTGEVSYDDNGAKVTARPDGSQSFSQIPPEQQVPVTGPTPAKTEEKGGLSSWFDSAYNTVADGIKAGAGMVVDAAGAVVDAAGNVVDWVAGTDTTGKTGTDTKVNDSITPGSPSNVASRAQPIPMPFR